MYRKKQKKQLEDVRNAQLRAVEDAKIRERIREGTWHDPRLDCVAGNGVMCELGIGDEVFGPADADDISADISRYTRQDSGGDHMFDQKSVYPVGKAVEPSRRQEDTQAVEAMPIVVLKGFESKGGSERREELLNTLAQWAASLAEGQVCFPSLCPHVYLLSP